MYLHRLVGATLGNKYCVWHNSIRYQRRSQGGSRVRTSIFPRRGAGSSGSRGGASPPPAIFSFGYNKIFNRGERQKLWWGDALLKIAGK